MLINCFTTLATTANLKDVALGIPIIHAQVQIEEFKRAKTAHNRFERGSILQ